MVLPKTGVWTEIVLKPLRRLSSVTANFFSSAGRQQQGLQARAAQEAHRSKGPPIKDYVFGNSSQAKSDDTWRSFIQHPLDVILNDSHGPGHHVTMFSNSKNMPFSTSVADQGRSRPDKEGPRWFVDKRGRRSKSLPSANFRKREFGSKRYRKFSRDKASRKGPIYNTRHQNRRTERKLLNKGPLSSMTSASPWGGKMAASMLDAEVDSMRVGTRSATEMQDLKVPKLQALDMFAPRPIKAFCKDSNLKSLNVVKGGVLPDHAKSNKDGRSTKEDPSDALEQSPSLKPVLEGAADFRDVFKETPAAGEARWPCGCLVGERKMKATVSNVCNNLEEAVQGFKCSLWKRALTVNNPYSMGAVNCVPYHVKAKN